VSEELMAKANEIKIRQKARYEIEKANKPVAKANARTAAFSKALQEAGAAVASEAVGTHSVWDEAIHLHTELLRVIQAQLYPLTLPCPIDAEKQPELAKRYEVAASALALTVEKFVNRQLDKYDTHGHRTGPATDPDDNMKALDAGMFYANLAMELMEATTDQVIELETIVGLAE